MNYNSTITGLSDHITMAISQEIWKSYLKKCQTGELYCKLLARKNFNSIFKIFIQKHKPLSQCNEKFSDLFD